MSRLVFLLEDYSQKVFLEGLLPRLFPGLPFLCVHHEGKQDLERSVPRKLRAWREPGVRFVVLRANDGGDCRETKRGLLGLCKEGMREDTLVRLACQELEAWYFGAGHVLADVYRRADLRNIGEKARFRDPDRIEQPRSSARSGVSSRTSSASRRPSRASRLTMRRRRALETSCESS
jgi:hypothetical protein